MSCNNVWRFLISFLTELDMCLNVKYVKARSWTLNSMWMVILLLWAGMTLLTFPAYCPVFTKLRYLFSTLCNVCVVFFITSVCSVSLSHCFWCYFAIGWLKIKNFTLKEHDLHSSVCFLQMKVGLLKKTGEVLIISSPGQEAICSESLENLTYLSNNSLSSILI